MTLPEILSALSDEEVVGFTIWAEARREPLMGRLAVGCTIRNRVHANRPTKYGSGFRGVCLHPWQYSCWTPKGGADNHNALLEEARACALGRKTSPSVKSAFWIAQGVVGGLYDDITNGAEHYYAPKAMVPRGAVPAWAHPPAVLTAVIGNHRFYRGA